MLGWLDALARLWLRWRMRVRCTQDEQLLEFVSAHARQNGMDITLKSPMVVVFANEAAAMLERHNAKNYLEFRMMSPDYDQPILVTIQWAYGQGPGERSLALEREIALMREL